MLREVVDRACVGGISYASARAAGVNFQACSFNHSDISPFKINDLRVVRNSVAQNPPFTNIRFSMSPPLQLLADTGVATPKEIVSDILIFSDHLQPFARGASPGS